MKKNVLIYLIFFICFFIFISNTYADSNIAGWWRATITIQQGDFVTGVWDTIYSQGKKRSYFYIDLPSSLSGTAYLALWNDLEENYILETYTLYIRNNIAVLVIPSAVDATNGDVMSGSTIILRVYGSPNNLYNMKGFYTLFDRENAVTPEEFVRMGPVSAYRIGVREVPKDVKDLIP
jgi:hypothetical protein